VIALSKLTRQRNLLLQLTLREVQARYRGSTLGMAWSVLQPLLMLAVYTIVFSQVFKAKWVHASTDTDGQLDFAIQLFAGLISFGIFSECLVRAPSVVIANPSYVTKVVFPLESLGIAVVAGSVFQGLTSLLVLGLFELIGKGAVPITIVLTPLVWLPLMLACLAMTWVVSALGVYLRDLNQIAGVAVNLLIYLSPVFYPISAAPRLLQKLLLLNPLTLVIEQTRRVAVNGSAPSWLYIVLGTGLGLLACEVSLRLFMKARKGFADVL